MLALPADDDETVFAAVLGPRVFARNIDEDGILGFELLGRPAGGGMAVVARERVTCLGGTGLAWATAAVPERSAGAR
jgi:hypothetical protein